LPVPSLSTELYSEYQTLPFHCMCIQVPISLGVELRDALVSQLPHILRLEFALYTCQVVTGAVLGSDAVAETRDYPDAHPAPYPRLSAPV
jgi:hypothetical protein